MSPTRVLHVVWRLSEGGGIPVVVRQLAAGLDPARFDVHVASARPLLAGDRLDGTVGATTLHGLGVVGRPTPARRVRLALDVARLARSLRPDVVHAHSGTAVYAALAAVVARPRLRVLEVHDAPGSGRHGRTTERLERLMARRLGFRPLVHSTSVRADVADRYRLPEPAVDLVPLGVDTSSFPEAGPSGRWRAELAVGPATPVVLYVARLTPTKNIPLFVDVAARLVDHPAGPVFALVAAGEGRAALEASVAGRGLGRRLFVCGARSRPDLVEAYLGSDVFLSTSDYEGFGLALVEAMAAGLPVVATAVGGVTDVVDAGTGILSPPGDAGALAGAVAALLDDPERRRAMGRAGRLRARARFDTEAFVGAVASLYERPRPPEPSLELAVLKSPPFGPAGAGGPPGALPYRIDHLRAEGFRLHWTDAPHRRPWTWPPLAAAVAAQQRLTPPLLQTMALAPRLARCPVTLAMFESEANALAVLRRLGVPPFGRTRLAVVACWLAELLPGLPARRRDWYRRAYEHVDRLFFFSSNQRAVLEEHLGMDGERLRFVAFGVDDEYFRPTGGPGGGYVLAAGRDRGRDWATTFAAVRGTGVRMKVLCRPRDLAGVDVPAEAEVLGYVDRAAYRDLLDRADAVVVCTHERAYPSGQSVFLEAMAMARPCVVTETPAMADYLRPGTNALGVPVGDAGALRSALARLAAEPDLRSRLGRAGTDDVRARLTARRMWRTIGTELRELAGS